jgi:hypothetical protein
MGCYSGVHLVKVFLPASHHQPCLGTRSEGTRGQARRAVRTDTDRVLRLARPVVGRATQAYSALWSGRGRPSARCAHGASSISVQEPFKN